MVSEFTAGELRLATMIARKVARINRGVVDADDVQGELHVWLCENENRVLEWRDQDGLGKAKLGTALYRCGQRHALRERVARSRTKMSDHSYYTIPMIEDILPEALDSDSWSLPGREHTGTRHAARPDEGNTRLAVLVDVRSAYDGLPEADRILLFERYMEGGMELAKLAAFHDVSESTIRRKIRRALGKMLDRLGGEAPWT